MIFPNVPAAKETTSNGERNKFCEGQRIIITVVTFTHLNTLGKTRGPLF